MSSIFTGEERAMLNDLTEQTRGALLASFEERANNVLAAVFGGHHHWPKVKKFVSGFCDCYEINYSGNLATWDSDKLTRLVISAHDQCIRAEVGPSGPGMVKIRLHPRAGRNGQMHKRHPSIETAIAQLRGY